MELHVDVLRHGLLEATHPVSAVLVKDGVVRWSTGADFACFWRSACKPFQLATSLRHLPVDVVKGLDDAALAVGASSHSGQPEHVALVERLLTRFGLKPELLQCGAHPPMHEASAKQVSAPTALHNNCSGKHTFMLAACDAEQWSLDYRPPDHPLQQQNRAWLEQLGGAPLGVAIDGCSVPTFHAPLSAMARTWTVLAEAMADEVREPLLHRIGWAMHRQPFFVSGAERLDLLVTQGAPEPLAVKVGAEGLFCIARPGKREGLAVKVHSGNADALAVAVRAVLLELGVALVNPWPFAVVKNVRGVPVGERVARWTD